MKILDLEAIAKRNIVKDCKKFVIISIFLRSTRSIVPEAKVSDPLQMYLADIYTASANLAGIPGLAIPSGFNSAGLPLGFQLMGSRLSENTLFTLGKMYQKAINYTPKLAIK